MPRICERYTVRGSRGSNYMTSNKKEKGSTMSRLMNQPAGLQLLIDIHIHGYNRRHILDGTDVYDLSLEDKACLLYSQILLMYSHPSSSGPYSADYRTRLLRKQV